MAWFGKVYFIVKRINPKLIISSAFVLIVYTALWIVCLARGLVFNHTPSLPLGWYIADERGPFAEFCPPPLDFISGPRGYRQKGSCEDGYEPLLKPIVTRPGDYVIFSGKGVSINAGEPLPNSAPRSKDTAGRPLEHYPYGFYPYVRGRVWLISSHNARSFDSRYFGPVSDAAIKRRLRALLVAGQ